MFEVMVIWLVACYDLPEETIVIRFKEVVKLYPISGIESAS
jgi:hypothetical protein